MNPHQTSPPLHNASLAGGHTCKKIITLPSVSKKVRKDNKIPPYMQKFTKNTQEKIPE